MILPLSNNSYHMPRQPVVYTAQDTLDFILKRQRTKKITAVIFGETHDQLTHKAIQLAFTDNLSYQQKPLFLGIEEDEDIASVDEDWNTYLVQPLKDNLKYIQETKPRSFKQAVELFQENAKTELTNPWLSLNEIQAITKGIPIKRIDHLRPTLPMYIAAKKLEIEPLIYQEPTQRMRQLMDSHLFFQEIKEKYPSLATGCMRSIQDETSEFMIFRDMYMTAKVLDACDGINEGIFQLNLGSYHVVDGQKESRPTVATMLAVMGIDVFAVSLQTEFDPTFHSKKFLNNLAMTTQDAQKYMGQFTHLMIETGNSIIGNSNDEIREDIKKTIEWAGIT